VQFTVVVLATFALGIVAAPLGLALGLSPVLVWFAAVLGGGCFVLVATAVLGRIVARVADRAGVVVPIAVPVIGWLWRRIGRRVVGPETVAAVGRATALVDRLGPHGAGLLGPLLGRWTMPLAGVALRAHRVPLVSWLLAGVALWAAVLVGASQLVIGALG
jgi:hypothetical protein